MTMTNDEKDRMCAYKAKAETLLLNAACSLKEVIGSAKRGEPYSPEELEICFGHIVQEIESHMDIKL